MTAPTLVIGDWRSWCGVCGEGADPEEPSHRTVLPGLSGTAGTVGCGAVWTHVIAEIASRIGAKQRIREMRPDLVLLPEAVDHRELPFRAGAPATAEATGCVTGRPSPLQSGMDANAGKPGPPSTAVTPPPGTGGPAGPTLSGPADSDLVWMSTLRRGLDAHRPTDRVVDGVLFTACGRSMRTGETLLAAHARNAYSALMCSRCWPGLHINHHQRIARRSL